MGRQPILTAAVGKKGVGKSFLTLQILRTYVQGTANFKGRRALILDVNDEYMDVDSIDVKHIAWFSAHPKIELRRVRVFKENGKKMSLNEISDTLNFILENYKDGALLIEDINKYVSDSYSTDLIGGIVTQRHVDCDLILHYQNIGRAGHPKILGNLNILRMHKTFDSVDRHENKFEDKYEMIKIAENIVNMKYRGYELGGKTYPANIRYYLYCNFDRDKIIGSFTKHEVERCIKEYIYVNENSTIKPMLRQRNDNGKFLYTASNVVKAKVDDLINLYFDF
jgi:hypothetical protein